MLQQDSKLQSFILMGNEESQQRTMTADEPKLKPNPIIEKLRSSLRLKILADNKTNSFVHTSFSASLTKKKGSLSRDYNPFVCLSIKLSGEQVEDVVITCCLISPICALVFNTEELFYKGGYFYHKEIELEAMHDGKQVRLIVKKSAIVNKYLAIIFLEKPFWELGWCGLTLVSNNFQINEGIFFGIYNQLKKKSSENQEVEEEQTQSKYKQYIKRVEYQGTQKMLAKGRFYTGCFIFKLINKKPYIVGIQRNEGYCQFFTNQTIDQIQKSINEYLTKPREKEILKAIDLEKYEMSCE